MSTIIFNSARPAKPTTFGLYLGRHQSDRLPIRSLPHEQAWFCGLSLALENVEADAPSGYTAFEREAFEHGQEQGFRELDQDRLEWCDACDRQTQQLRESLEEQEAAEMGSQLGHDDTADGREDGPSIGFASELLRAVEANDDAPDANGCEWGYTAAQVAAIEAEGRREADEAIRLGDEADATTPTGSDTIEVVSEVGEVRTVAVPAFVLSKCPAPTWQEKPRTLHQAHKAASRAKRAAGKAVRA